MVQNRYRKIYESYYGKILEGFQIHHIDHNRSNNVIENLLCISSELHHRYHMAYNVAKEIDLMDIKTEYERKMIEIWIDVSFIVKKKVENHIYSIAIKSGETNE